MFLNVYDENVVCVQCFDSSVVALLLRIYRVGGSSLAQSREFKLFTETVTGVLSTTVRFVWLTFWIFSLSLIPELKPIYLINV